MKVNCKSVSAPYVNRTETYQKYLNDIRKYPLLTKEEERILIKQAQENKGKNETLRKQALDILVGSNQLFIMSVAKKYSNRDNLLDLINEANIGLIKAIDKFDLNKTYKLITYAVWWVMKQINNYMAEKNDMVKPANAHKIRNYVTNISRDFFIQNERYPQLEELQELIRERYNFNVENKQDLELFQSVSIDEGCCNNEDDMCVGESVKFNDVTASNNIDDDMEDNDASATVEFLLSTLKEREREIMKMTYGIGCEETSLEVIADKFNLTKERIRQIVNKCLEKLKTINCNN